MVWEPSACSSQHAICSDVGALTTLAPKSTDDAEGLPGREHVVSGSMSPELGCWLSALRTHCVTLGCALDLWTIAPHL